MSKAVRALLEELDLLHLTTHEDRVEIDREIERRTGEHCDEGVRELTKAEFVELVKQVIERRRKKREELVAYA